MITQGWGRKSGSQGHGEGGRVEVTGWERGSQSHRGGWGRDVVPGPPRVGMRIQGTHGEGSVGHRVKRRSRGHPKVPGTQEVGSAGPQNSSAHPQSQASCFSFPYTSILHSPAMSTRGPTSPHHGALPPTHRALCSPSLPQLQPPWETKQTGCRSCARGCGMSPCTTCPSQVSTEPTSRSRDAGPG